MPARNWDADRRRKKRAAVVNEKVLAALDPSTYVYVDEEEDPRPKCLVCSVAVTPDGDEAKQLSSGSWVHEGCIQRDEEKIEPIPTTVTDRSDGETKLFELEVQFTRYVRVQVIVGPDEDPRAFLSTAEILEHEISDVSVVVTEIES